MSLPWVRVSPGGKKGDQIAHHFAHEADADCATAYEAMLHKLGKQMILDAGGLNSGRFGRRGRHLRGFNEAAACTPRKPSLGPSPDVERLYELQ
jgi:hypothetical protein